MKQRKFGANGPMVSAIGLGCMSFGNFFGPTDEKTSLKCLDAAWEMGINNLDTAEIYGAGLSETVIGKHRRSTKKPFFIATKGGIRRDPNPGFDNSKAYFEEALDGSLRRLGVDYIDLYYAHRRDPNTPIEELAQTMEGFVKAGKIGGWGLSEVSPTTLRRAHAVFPVMAVQSEYSLWTRSPELGLIQDCERLGVAFVPFSPVARGLFVDNPVDMSQTQETDFRRKVPRLQEPNLSDNLAVVEKLQDFAHARGWTTAATAIAWVLSQGDHLIPIPATRTADHLPEWQGADAITFSDADLQELYSFMPVGWAWGDRYWAGQWAGPEKYS